MLRYGMSALLAGAAALLTLAIQPLLGGKATLIFFAIAVAMSAAYGGLWPGLLTTLLSMIAVGLLFQNSNYLLAQSQSSLVLFALLGLTISAIIHLLHRVGSSRVDLQACKLEYSIVSPK